MRHPSPFGVVLAFVGAATAACGGSDAEGPSSDAADADAAAEVDAPLESSGFDAFHDAARDDVRPDDASAASACADLAGALCDRIAACAPFLVGREFVDAADCHARATLACLQRMGLSDSYPPLDVAVDCTLQLKSIACDDFFARGVHGFAGLIDYPCPVIGGLREDGRFCVGDAQCASGYCAYRWTGCGVCKPPPVDGAGPPDGYECGPWLALGDDKRCHAPGATGAACTTNAPCASNLYCVGGACAAGASEGAPCDDAHPCDWTHGLSCDAASGACVAVALAREGQACVRRLADGVACVPTSGPPCTGPSDCIAGTCAVADDTTCN